MAAVAALTVTVVALAVAVMISAVVFVAAVHNVTTIFLERDFVDFSERKIEIRSENEATIKAI